jgi:aminomethyltransferase
VGLVSYDPVPVRAHAKIVDARDSEVGEVTSGTVSPTLNRPVMLAYLDAGALRESADGSFRAVVRDKRPAVHVTPLPFVAKRYKR